MKKKQHIILSIEEGSLAEQHGIVEGDILISINGEDIKDIFDYQYLIQDEKLI